MKLSSKVLILWGVGVFLLPLPVTPLLEKGFDSKLVLWVVYLLVTSAVFCVFYIKYKTCVVKLTPSKLSLESGYFIRKHLHIKQRHILAATRVSTPLSQKLKLSTLVLYCEGSTFILPPLTEAFTKQIESKIQSSEENYEA